MNLYYSNFRTGSIFRRFFMQLDVQWFVSALMDNELISADDAKTLNAELGGEPDLMTFAQEFLSRVTQGLSEQDQQSWMEQIQTVINYAAEQAQSGAKPPHAEEITSSADAAKTIST